MTVTRRRFVVASALAGAGLFVPRVLLAQASSTNVFEALRRGVGIFKGRGGTIGWLAAKDGALVVDSQFPDNAKACLEGVLTRAERAKVDVLVNTHHHFDHTGGNGVFQSAGVEIVAHANVPELQRQQTKDRGETAEPVVPTRTFTETLTLDIGAAKIDLAHYGPAHTGGDAVVHFQGADVVHMGDLVFNRWFPFIDRKGGASIENWIAVLERVHERFTDETLFVFGHGKAEAGVVGKREDVRRMRDFLEALLEFARRRAAEGASPEQIAAAESLPGFLDYESVSERLSLKANLETALEELGLAAVPVR